MKGNQGQGGKGNAQHNDPSTTLGIGRRTSGEAGSTPTHETMAETGGSGGAGLTDDTACSRQSSGEEARARQSAGDSAMNASVRPTAGGPADPSCDVASEGKLDSGARGFQDTRSRQAGGTGIGLGTPETGANQNAADLEHQPGRKK